MGIGLITGRAKNAAGRDPASRPAGQPSRLRSFDPGRAADLEYRAWTGYYRVTGRRCWRLSSR
jgi:hypothetical protein